MIRSTLRLIAACFITAIFVYTIYLLHLELLTKTYIAGFNQGAVECARESGYIVPDTGHK